MYTFGYMLFWDITLKDRLIHLLPVINEKKM